MRKKYVKITSWLLIMTLSCGVLFTGCKNDKKQEEANKSETNKEATEAEQKEFDTYLSELFVNEMSSSSVSTHFSLEDAESYGIEFDEPTWGEPVTAEGIEEDYKDQESILKELKAFDYDLLNYEQKITYDTLCSFIENSLASKDYYLFDEVFSPINGAHAEIPIIFSEYEFITADDIDDYLTLLETVDDYIDNLLEYERYRAQRGYFLTDHGADDVIGQCEEFISAEENCLVSIFNDKLTDFGIENEDKESYMKRLNEAISNDLIPAYRNIIDTLTELKGSRSSELGLCHFDNGEEYYASLLRHYTGSAKTPDEIIDAVAGNMSKNLSLIYLLSGEDASLYEEMVNYEYPDGEPSDIIALQLGLAKDYFPAIESIPYEVKNVPASLEASMSPAFYLVPPIDNAEKNMIYINHSEEYKSMNLFSTLAHEGVPGHMYQCYYFASTNPNPMRNVISFSGYNEGWATYVEYYSYLFAGMTKPLAKLTEAYDLYSFAIYAQVDLGIHYEGWDIDDVAYYLEACGLYDEGLDEELFYLLIDDPGVYLQYFVGYLEIEELRAKAEEELKNFDEIEFHRFFLEIGPTYFDIIDKYMDMWIKEENGYQ